MSKERLLVPLLLAVLAGCGGGGGDQNEALSSKIPNFQGVWEYTSETIFDDCDSDLVGESETVNLTISQNGTAITAHAGDGSGAQGVTTGDDSFLILASATSPSGSCVIRGEVEFSDLSGDTATVVTSGSVDCPNQVSCRFESSPTTAVRGR